MTDGYLLHHRPQERNDHRGRRKSPIREIEDTLSLTGESPKPRSSAKKIPRAAKWSSPVYSQGRPDDHAGRFATLPATWLGNGKFPGRFRSSRISAFADGEGAETGVGGAGKRRGFNRESSTMSPQQIQYAKVSEKARLRICTCRLQYRPADCEITALPLTGVACRARS